MIAEIVEAVLARPDRRRLRRGNDRRHDVVDIGEVAFHAAVVEHLDRPAGEDRLGEQIGGHVRAAPGSIHGKEAQPGTGQAVEPAIALGDQLAGALGRGIERDRMIGAVLDGERLLRVGAIDRGRTGVDEAFQRRQPPRRFEQHDLALDVRLDIGERLGQRIAHPGLGGEVDDPVDVGVALDQGRHRHRIGDIDRSKHEAIAAFELREARTFQRDIVIRVQIVDADDLLAAIEQMPRDMKADKTRAACDQQSHGAVRTGSALSGARRAEFFYNNRPC